MQAFLLALFTDTELFDKRAVRFEVCPLEIFQELSPRADDFQQRALCAFIFRKSAFMFRELLDALGGFCGK